MSRDPRNLPPPYRMITTCWDKEVAEGLVLVSDVIKLWRRVGTDRYAEVLSIRDGELKELVSVLEEVASTHAVTADAMWSSPLYAPPPGPTDLPDDLRDAVNRGRATATPDGHLDFGGWRATEFSQYVQDQLRYYVYLLQDPRDGAIFYVGKGVGNRVFAHARAAVEFQDGGRLDLIRDIRTDGLEPHVMLLRFGLDERSAFDVESAAIQLLGLESLQNRVHGHHIANGLMSVDVAISKFEAPEAPPITEPVLLVRITKLWDPAMSPSELYETTRGWWKVGPRRDKAAYAMAITNGIVREVYEIQGWRPRREGDRSWEDDVGKRPRWGFEGVPAKAMSHFRNTNVSRYFPRGVKNPLKYVNC